MVPPVFDFMVCFVLAELTSRDAATWDNIVALDAFTLSVARASARLDKIRLEYIRCAIAVILVSASQGCCHAAIDESRCAVNVVVAVTSVRRLIGMGAARLRDGTQNAYGRADADGCPDAWSAAVISGFCEIRGQCGGDDCGAGGCCKCFKK